MKRTFVLYFLIAAWGAKSTFASFFGGEKDSPLIKVLNEVPVSSQIFQSDKRRRIFKDFQRAHSSDQHDLQLSLDHDGNCGISRISNISPNLCLFMSNQQPSECDPQSFYSPASSAPLLDPVNIIVPSSRPKYISARTANPSYLLHQFHSYPTYPSSGLSYLNYNPSSLSDYNRGYGGDSRPITSSSSISQPDEILDYSHMVYEPSLRPENQFQESHVQKCYFPQSRTLNTPPDLVHLQHYAPQPDHIQVQSPVQQFAHFEAPIISPQIIPVPVADSHPKPVPISAPVQPRMSYQVPVAPPQTPQIQQVCQPEISQQTVNYQVPLVSPSWPTEIQVPQKSPAHIHEPLPVPSRISYRVSVAPLQTPQLQISQPQVQQPRVYQLPRVSQQAPATHYIACCPNKA